jgi:hypothetical protein
MGLTNFAVRVAPQIISVDILDYGPIEQGHFSRYLVTIAYRRKRSLLVDLNFRLASVTCVKTQWARLGGYPPSPDTPAAPARKLKLRRQLKNPESESLGVLLATQGGT